MDSLPTCTMSRRDHCQRGERHAPSGPVRPDVQAPKPSSQAVVVTAMRRVVGRLHPAAAATMIGESEMSNKPLDSSASVRTRTDQRLILWTFDSDVEGPVAKVRSNGGTTDSPGEISR